MRKIIAAVMIVILLAGVAVGWFVHGSRQTKTAPSPSGTQGIGNHIDNSSLKSRISYTLPSGWQDAACDGKDTIYLLPPGMSLNCNADPASSISLSIVQDATAGADCNQLAPTENVRKHTCKSLNINGRKSLQALTVYMQSVAHSEDDAVADYYVATDKGTFRLEYRYNGEAVYQVDYDQIAHSIKNK